MKKNVVSCGYVIYVLDSGRYYAGDDMTTGILAKAKVYKTKEQASANIFDLHQRFCPDDFIHFIAKEVRWNDDFELELVD